MGRELAQRKRTYPEVWRLGELIRHYVQTVNVGDLRVRSETATTWLNEYNKVHAEVDAEFRAAGNHSDAEIIVETRRRMEDRDLPPEL
jgi:hypothetical protein